MGARQSNLAEALSVNSRPRGVAPLRGVQEVERRRRLRLRHPSPHIALMHYAYGKPKDTVALEAARCAPRHLDHHRQTRTWRWLTTRVPCRQSSVWLSFVHTLNCDHQPVVPAGKRVHVLPQTEAAPQRSRVDRQLREQRVVQTDLVVIGYHSTQTASWERLR